MTDWELIFNLLGEKASTDTLENEVFECQKFGINF